MITIFSQYGEIVNIHLPKRRAEPTGRDGGPPRDPPQKGHNRGFGFLMYEDQRSTVLAVDNLNGAKVLGRTLRVDHVANFRQERIRDADGNLVEAEQQMLNCAPPEIVLDEEPGDEADLEDPMAAYLADKARRKRHSSRDREREREHERGRKERRRRERSPREREHHHHHHHHHRHREHRDRERSGRHHRTHRETVARTSASPDRSRSMTPTMDRHAPIHTP